MYSNSLASVKDFHGLITKGKSCSNLIRKYQLIYSIFFGSDELINLDL